MRSALAIAAVLLLGACSSEGVTPSAGESSSLASHPSAMLASPSPMLASASASGSASPPPHTVAPEIVQADGMVITLVDNLSVRAAPGLEAIRLGTLPADEVAFVADGPVLADGHTWYQLASDSPCAAPADPRFHCNWWMGWVAGTGEDGSSWLEPSAAGCPSGPLNVTTYLGLTALHRLSCFGDATWTLRAFMSRFGGGRGGISIFSTEPAWLEEWGTIIFPQLEESEEDGGNSLFMYAHPDLTCDFGGRNAGCAFEPFLGQWIEIQGHLDDPAAATCRTTYNTDLVDTVEEPLPPLPDVAESVVRCRSLFVATGVRAADL